jgi:preprotein translocase subunit SecG
MTVVLATLFMVTSLTLSLIHQSPVGSSIMLDEPMKALPAAPVTPNATSGTAQAPAKK